MAEESKTAADNTATIEELLDDQLPIPLIAPFVSGTPCLTPDGEVGTIVSDAIILEAPADQGGRKFIASYWDEARLHAHRGAKVADDSSLRVRSRGRIRRFPAKDVRIVVRRLKSLDED